MTDLAFARLCRHSFQMINLSQHLIGFIDNPLSGLRQEYNSLRSLKELDPEFILQLPDLLAQRRLTDV